VLIKDIYSRRTKIQERITNSFLESKYVQGRVYHKSSIYM